MADDTDDKKGQQDQGGGGDSKGQQTQGSQGDQGGGGDQGGAGAGTGDAKTYTQAELDQLMAGRLGAERKKFADYEDLKTKAAEFDKLTEAQKTDLQKAQDRAAAEERRRIDVERELAEARLTQAITTAAEAKKISGRAATRMLDVAAVTYDDAGKPNNLDTLLDELVKTEPWLAQSATGSAAGAADQGARGAAGTDLESMSVDDFRKKFSTR